MAQAIPPVSDRPTPPRTRSGPCSECGTVFEPKRRWHQHCSDACRAKAWKARQRALDFSPPLKPVPIVIDQRVPQAERPRLKRHAVRIWDALEAECAISNAGFALMFPPGTAWRTRLSEVRAALRKHRGWAKGRDPDPIPHHDCGGGLVWYWIERLP